MTISGDIVQPSPTWGSGLVSRNHKATRDAPASFLMSLTHAHLNNGEAYGGVERLAGFLMSGKTNSVRLTTSPIGLGGGDSSRNIRNYCYEQ
ncbi:hypothetical protein ETH90_25710 [Salmonella enterica]|nr:hypothetical protein [Salmonella enterica]